MTNEEAIEILKILPKFIDYSITFQGENIEQAIDKAIEALREQALIGKMNKAYYKETRKADGYCDIARMTSKSTLYINALADFYRSYSEDMREAENEK